MADFLIRAAAETDCGLILSLLKELAAYEKLEHQFRTSTAAIARDFFGPARAAQCDLAFEGGQAVGIVTYYWTYGSFTTARGLFVEDLFVMPDFRGRGYGKALLKHLARRAVDAGASRLDWWALDWNAPAIAFYKDLGAERISAWLPFRLDGASLTELAG